MLASTLEPTIPAVAGASPIDEAARAEGLQATRQQTNRAILDVLTRNLTAKARILDVGCGHGLFIKEAQAQGFRAEGVEPDANVVDLARRATGAVVRHGFFPLVVADDDRFDAIVFNDVLEHIPDASGAVAASLARLAPGGILVLNCPDRRGVFYRIAAALDAAGIRRPFLRMWQSGLPSPHVWYFASSDLVRLGERAGFEHCTTVRTSPITREGLYQRIAYVRDHSLGLRFATYAATLIMLPFLGVLPGDTSIVVLRRPTTDAGPTSSSHW